MYKIELLPQECAGSYKFTGKAYMTLGFQEEFGEFATIIVFSALQKVINDRVQVVRADYLQVCTCNVYHFLDYR